MLLSNGSTEQVNGNSTYCNDINTTSRQNQLSRCRKRLKQNQVQQIFENDLVVAFAMRQPWRSPYFSPETLREKIKSPPVSQRMRKGLFEKGVTWVWVLAETVAFSDSNIGYLIARAERWPKTHLEYGIASKKAMDPIGRIDTWENSLFEALDWN